MSIIAKMKGWVKTLLVSKTKDEFHIEPVCSAEVDEWVGECVRIYQGNPCWLDEEDHIDTVNFAKTLCSETSRLAMLGTGIRIDGSPRAEWLQAQIDNLYYQLRHWVEYGCAYGTVILKPNGKTVEMYPRNRFEVTHVTGDRIDGVVFSTQEQSGGKWYTRLEYHRFSEDGRYLITNRCFTGDAPENTTRPVDIGATPWAGLQEDISAANVRRPLFAVFRTPQANNIDPDSPLGLPVFSEAVQELRDLDIAYSRNAKEMRDSKRTVLLDSDVLLPSGGRVVQSPDAWERRRTDMKLPDYIRNVRSSGQETLYHEINPTLNTEIRIAGINALLNQIGYKAGFSNGYFVFNEASGIQTATGVEAEQQRTIQYIKDIRDKLEGCLHDLIYVLDVFADLYRLAPPGKYEVNCDFGDITYNRDEDRARWWGYVSANKVPAWLYFVKFEGMTEEEAKAMVEEAAPKAPTLFGGEE